jgi:hypothetical protein
MWYHHLELNGGPPSWNHFIQLLQIHFALPLMMGPIDDVTLVRCEGLVDDYCTRFMALSCRDPSITGDHKVQIFVVGLGEPLRTDVALQRPSTLDVAVMYARAYEHRALPPSAPPPQRSANHFFSKLPPQPPSHPTITALASFAALMQGNPSIPTLRLLATEIA